MYLNDIYHDRGMKKWAGFYLSDHTAKINSVNTERYRHNVRREKQTMEEIGFTINEALIKALKASVQLEALNEERDYYDDVVGFVTGYDEHGIYFGNELVRYDEIRSIEIFNENKWSNIASD